MVFILSKTSTCTSTEMIIYKMSGDNGKPKGDIGKPEDGKKLNRKKREIKWEEKCDLKGEFPKRM